MFEYSLDGAASYMGPSYGGISQLNRAVMGSSYLRLSYMHICATCGSSSSMRIHMWHIYAHTHIYIYILVYNVYIDAFLNWLLVQWIIPYNSSSNRGVSPLVMAFRHGAARATSSTSMSWRAAISWNFSRKDQASARRTYQHRPNFCYAKEIPCKGIYMEVF